MSITYLIPLLLLTSCMSTKMASKNNSETYWNEKWQNNYHDQHQANPFAITPQWEERDSIKNSLLAMFFLASNDSSYMSGQVLHPNGGEIING